MKPLLFALLSLFVTHLAVAGPLVKCKGADGKVSFSDTPCPDRPGMKTLSPPADTSASPSSPRERSSGPYVPGKSPFTDKMLQMLVVKCNQGEKDACRYAEKVRGGNYDFGNMLVDTAEDGCNKGDKEECARLCSLDNARAWCKRQQATAPTGQNWWKSHQIMRQESSGGRYDEGTKIFCFVPGASKADGPPPSWTVTYQGSKFRDPATGQLHPTLNAAATAACASSIANRANQGRN